MLHRKLLFAVVVTSNPTTIQTCSVVLNVFPQLEVKATRKALDTTPQKFINVRMVYQVPTTQNLNHFSQVLLPL